MKRFQHKRSLLRLLWHPQEGFWNWDLYEVLEKIFPIDLNKKIIRIIMKILILIDTVYLFFKAFFRRVSKLGIFKTLFFKINIPNNISVLYFDLGIHKEAKELLLMVNEILPRVCRNYTAYGFEASQDYFKQAQLKFKEREDTVLKNAALCYEIPKNSKIKLYKDQGNGFGSSIYKPEYDVYEEVKAIRFSDWLNENNINLKNNICLLRMNIEGAEYDVIKDLIETDLVKNFDGFYGMWDDVSKINFQHGEVFRRILVENQIFPFTFNNRDFSSPLRLRCIKYDILTSIHTAVQRLKKI